MRYSIMGFNQEELIKIEKDNCRLDMDDILLLDYIQKALSQPSMKKIFKDGQPYVWLNHDKILEDIPILHIQKDMLRKRLSKLISLELIISETIASETNKGTRVYYTITEKTILLQYVDDMTTRKKLQVVDGPLVKNSECSSGPLVKNYYSYNKLNIDNKLKKSLSKDNEYAISEKSSSFLGSAKILKQEKDNDRIEKFLEYYKSLNLPSIKKVNDKRRKAILNILNGFDESEVKQVLDNFSQSDFLLGKATDFKANIDWILKEDNFIKTLEGKYNNRTTPKKKSGFNDMAVSETYTEAELKELERIDKEREARGLQTRF